MLLLGGIGMIVVIGVLFSSDLRTKLISAASKLFIETKARAEQGEAQAQCDLGTRYLTGWDVETNPVESAKWFRKSAQQNHAAGQLQLAECFLEGRGVTKDKIEAVRWFRVAAEQGHPPAQRRLGDCYANSTG